jgi:plasmid stabilization system protein ParE
VRYASVDVALERAEAIWTYEQDQRRRGRGARFDAELLATFQRIDSSPQSFPRIARINRPVVRRAKVMKSPYSVVFYVHQGEPIIVAVEHGKREPLYWRERLR